MAYARGNPKTKKALKELHAKGRLELFEPGIGSIPRDGNVYVEGPHYPAAHTWYATVVMENGVPVRVR